MGEQNILRATEFLWKFWWFCFFIILLPVLCAIVGYNVFPLFIAYPNASYYGAIFSFIGSLAFFERFFEKYRKHPAFQDDVHIFDTRIYGPFVFLLLATVMKPLEAVIALLPNVSTVLAIISLPHIYNFVWIYAYYYFFQWNKEVRFTPLFSRVNREFSRSLHEIVIFGIYIIEIIFLEVLQDIPYIWLHALIIPLATFGIIWLVTNAERKQLRTALINNVTAFGCPVQRRFKKTPIEPELAVVHVGKFDAAMQVYLGKLTKLAVTVIFLLLFQFLLEFAAINVAEIQANANLGATYTLIFSLIAILFVKTQVDLALRYKPPRSWSTSSAPKIRILQNFNIILTGIFAGIIFGWSIVASTEYLALIILAGSMIVAYFEGKAHLFGRFNIYAQAGIWSIIGIELCWGILPLDWIYQFIAFLGYMYVVLEIFKRTREFQKKDVAIVQNMLVTVIIFAVLFAIYPPVLEAYLFSLDPSIQLISHALFVIFFLIIALITVLYRLYFSQFKRQTSRLLKVILSASFFFFLCFLTVIIYFRLFPQLDASSTWSAALATICIVPSTFAAFSHLNCKMGILTPEDRQHHLYYSYWTLSIIIVIVIAVISPTFSGIVADILYFLIILQSLTQFGVMLNRFSEVARQKIARVSSYFLTFISLIFFLDLFGNVLRVDLFYALFLALVISSGIAHLFTLGNRFSTKLAHYMTLVTFYILTLAIFVNVLNAYVGTPYVYVFPLLLAAIMFLLPNLYALKALKEKKEIFRKILKVNVQVIAVLVGAYQVPDALAHVLPGGQLNVISFLIFPFIVYAIAVAIFSFIGIITGLYSREEVSRNCYYAAWPLLPAILALLLSTYPDIVGVSWSVLFCALDLQIMQYWAKSLGKVNQGFYDKFTTLNSIVFVAGVFWVIYGALWTLPGVSLFAVFLGLGGVCGAAWVFTKFFALYPPKYVKWLTSFTMYFLVIVVLYYSVLGFAESSFVYAIPPLLTAAISFLPLVVSYKLGLMKRESLIKFANCSLLVVASTITSIPTIIGFEFLSVGLPFPTLEVLSYTSFILLASIMLFERNSSKLEFKPEMIAALKRAELFVWLLVKAMLCIALAIVLPLTSILEESLVIIVFGAVLSPITLEFLKRSGREVRNLRITIDQLIAVIYCLALTGLYITTFWPATSNLVQFVASPVLGVAFNVINLFLFLNLCAVAYKRLTTKFQPQLTNDERPTRDSPGQKWGAFFGISFSLFVVFSFQYPAISTLLLPIAFIITLSFRNCNPIMRLVQAILLGFITFINTVLLVDYYAIVIPPSAYGPLIHNIAIIIQQTYATFGMNVLYYFISLLVVFIVSIKLNPEDKNLLEFLTTFISISAILFICLSLFTTILFPNIVTISILAFLLQLGPFLLYYKHPAAKMIGKTCVVLTIIICIQYLAYQVWFTPAELGTANGVLAPTLTASITAFSFVMLFNKLPEKYRGYCYIIALSTIISATPIFIYILLLEALPALEATISLIIALDIGILLFFLSTGIYRWSFSRLIWDAAWWAWMLLPVVNFSIIAKLLGGIDVVTNALDFFGAMGFSGSLILSIIICTLLYLPVLYTKLKTHFYKILLFIWAETLFLVAWIAQNLFGSNIFLSAGFFIVLSLFLLMPLLYRLKVWKILSYFWIAMTVINVIFVHSYLSVVGIPLENVLSIDLILTGFLSIVYSFFPNLRHRQLIIVASYCMLLIGVFFLIFFMLVAITLNPYISVNLSFIILAISLFSSKYLKLNQKNIHFAIAILLISNISLLFLFSFIIIPGLELFAVFLFLAVFGGSFYVFNLYKFIKHIDDRIPWGIMALGCALAVSDLCFIFWNVNSMFLGFTCSMILLIFLYRYLHPYRYVLWVLYPIPATFLVQAYLLPVLGSLLIFGWVATYIALFQIIFGILHRLAVVGNISIKRRYLELLQKEAVQKAVNSVCFLVNSVFIAIWAALASPIPLINQVFEFLILWSLLTIISLKYMKTGKFEKVGEGLFRALQGITIFLYILIPLTTTFNLVEIFLLSGFQITDFVILIGIFFSGILFVELHIIDRLLVVDLFPRTRNQMVFWSWLFLGNLLAVQLFFLYENIFFLCLMLSLLNLPSVYFLSPFDISDKLKNFIRYALVNSILVEISLYLASVLTELVVAVYETILVSLAFPLALVGAIPSPLFSAGLFSLFYFLTTAFLNRWLPPKLRVALNLGLFIAFQLLVAIIWSWGIDLLFLGTPTSLNLLAIVETLLAIYPFQTIHQYKTRSAPEGEVPPQISPEEELRTTNKRYAGGLTFLLYCELSALVFNTCFMMLPVLESSLLATLALFLLSALEITTVQKVGRKLIRTVHATSYIALSVLWCGFLLQFTSMHAAIRGLSVFSLIIMQFYTNIAIFNARVRYHSQDLEKLTTTKNKVQTIIGLCFYGAILFFLQQAMSALDMLVQGLALCLGAYLLMICDRHLFKFNVEKVSRIIQAVSWAGFLILLGIFALPWILIIPSLLPPLLLLYYAGLANFVKILDFSEFIAAKQQRIFQILIIATYFTLTAWPIFFATLDWIVNFILACISTCILLLFTYADAKVEAIPKSIRLVIQKGCLVFIGGIISGAVSFLISPIIDTLFVTFGTALNVCLFLLFFTSLLALFLRPFQQHSTQALGFWHVIFTLGGLVLYFVSNSLIAGVGFIGVFFLAYWIIFVPAVRQFLIKWVRAVYLKFQALWTAFKNTLIHTYQKMVAFWHLHFQGIWICLWAACGAAVFYLVWDFFKVPVTSAIPIGLLVFILGLFGIIAKRGGEQEKELSFQTEFLYYASLYFSTTWALFSFFPWNLFLFLGAILLFGGVLLFFVDRAYKRKRLNYTWRFIAILSFVILFIVTGVLLGVQLSGNYNFV